MQGSAALGVEALEAPGVHEADAACLSAGHVGFVEGIITWASLKPIPGAG